MEKNNNEAVMMSGLSTVIDLYSTETNTSAQIIQSYSLALFAYTCPCTFLYSIPFHVPVKVTFKHYNSTLVSSGSLFHIITTLCEKVIPQIHFKSFPLSP